jgi:hypothetical protein
MSDLIKQAAEAMNSKPIGMRAPATTSEDLQNSINAAARALESVPLRQGSNQFSQEIAQQTYNEANGIVPEKEIPKTANVREKLERVDISADLISASVSKLNNKPVISA